MTAEQFAVVYQELDFYSAVTGRSWLIYHVAEDRNFRMSDLGDAPERCDPLLRFKTKETAVRTRDKAYRRYLRTAKNTHRNGLNPVTSQPRAE